MTDIRANLISGQWRTGHDAIENPYYSELAELIGPYTQATTRRLDTTLAQRRIAPFDLARSALEGRYRMLTAT